MTFARNSDPQTSHDAAASVTHLTDKRAACLHAMQTLGPCTDEDLWSFYNAMASAGRCPLQSPSGLRTRRAELTREGKVRDSGLRATTASGRRSILWEVSP